MSIGVLQRLVASLIIGGVLVMVLLVIPVSTAQAGFSFSGAAAGALNQKQPYGGSVLGWFPCTCNTDGAIWMIIGPPSPGIYLYKPLDTKLHARYMPIRPGGYHLGWRTALMGNPECSMYVGEDCIDWYYQYKIEEIGTS